MIKLVMQYVRVSVGCHNSSLGVGGTSQEEAVPWHRPEG